jgi:hypothetical protein
MKVLFNTMKNNVCNINNSLNLTKLIVISFNFIFSYSHLDNSIKKKYTILLSEIF